MMVKCRVSGVGSYVPHTVLTNEELSTRLDTSDEWIAERTGIRQRHIAAVDEYTSHLGTYAARAALADAGLAAENIDIIILATATPDHTFPATATEIQRMLNIPHAVAFDVNAACSGFVYALHVADALLKTGQYQHALVIGAETMSRVVDWHDRRTAILFGDGAGACVLSAIHDGSESGILMSQIASNGEYSHLLQTNGGVSTTQTAGFLFMEGKEVFRHAVEKMSQSVLDVCQNAGIGVEALRYVIPHQANARIMAACAKKLELQPEQIVMTVDKHANTSSASIPLALAYAKKNATLNTGDYIMLTALGAGFTWGACLIRW